MIPTEESGDEGRVLGLDNVAINIPIAGIGNRILAAFVDYLIIALLMIGLLIIGGVISALIRNRWALPVIYLAGGFILNWGYFAIAEIVTKGQTPGKQLFGLRVVTDAGGLPSAGALMIRNLMRFIDNLIGVFLMALDPRSRRLGDRLGGTLVIHDKPAGSQILVLGRVPNGWGPAEVALAEAFFDRRETLEFARQQELAKRIIALALRDDPDFLTGTEPGPTSSATMWRAFLPDWI